MAITTELSETSRNAAAAALAALGVALLSFAAAGMAGAVFEAFDAAELSGGDVAVVSLAAVGTLLLVVVGALLLRASGEVRDGYAEQPVVKAVIALGVAFTVLGVLFLVADLTDSRFPGSVPFGTLLAITGLLTVVAGNSYRSVSASVAATGAIFGIAASAVLVSVQVVGGDLLEPLDAIAPLAGPVLVGIVPAVGLLALALGALLRAFLWDTDWADVAHGLVHLSVIVLGLGLLIGGAGELAGLPWDSLGTEEISEAVLVTGLATGQALVTVAGFLLLAGSGLGFTAASARLYERSGLSVSKPRAPRARREDGGPDPARGCPTCEAEVPADASYCPACGCEVAIART